MNSNSPWSAYGRHHAQREIPGAGAAPNPGLVVASEVLRTQQLLKQYLANTLHEYNEIRGGRTGYARIVAEALKPAPRPESIEETLRRLSGVRPADKGDRADPSSTV